MILVCGQNCAWQLIYRFERVTAGAVNRVLEVQRAAAGKGINVARALTALGLPATLLAYLGGANGRRMRAALRDEGIAARVVETAADTRTCVTLLEGPAGAAARSPPRCAWSTPTWHLPRASPRPVAAPTAGRWCRAW